MHSSDKFTHFFAPVYFHIEPFVSITVYLQSAKKAKIKNTTKIWEIVFKSNSKMYIAINSTNKKKKNENHIC